MKLHFLTSRYNIIIPVFTEKSKRKAHKLNIIGIFSTDNIAAINRRLTGAVYQKMDISAFMGGVFEEICKQYLWEQNRQGKVAMPFIDLGRWWGNDPKKKQEMEIDIVGTGDNNTGLFGECKWTNEKVGTGVLDELIYKSTLFHYNSVHYYLFAKTGFTKGCQAQAEALGNVKKARQYAIVNNDSQFFVDNVNPLNYTQVKH